MVTPSAPSLAIGGSRYLRFPSSPLPLFPSSPLPAYMFATIAWPNSEHFTSFAPTISRAKS